MPLVTDTKTVKNIIGELPLGVELEGVTEKEGKLTVLLRETNSTAQALHDRNLKQLP